MKKYISILLVAIMLMSVAVIPASANEISPRAIACECGGKYVNGTYYYIQPAIIGICTKNTGYAHYICTKYTQYRCNTCGDEYNNWVIIDEYEYCSYKNKAADHSCIRT